MKLRKSCYCQTSFEDDFVENPENPDSPVRPGGLNVVDHLSSLLRADGFYTTTPKQHSDYGWAIFVSKEADRYWLMASRLDNDIIVATENQNAFSWLGIGTRNHAAFLGRLHLLIQKDPHFQNISWFMTGQSDYRNPSFQDPATH